MCVCLLFETADRFLLSLSHKFSCVASRIKKKRVGLVLAEIDLKSPWMVQREKNESKTLQYIKFERRKAITYE